MKKRSMSLCFCLALSCLTWPALADEHTVTTSAPVNKIKSYGNVVLNLSRDEMQAAGINLGDLVTVSFGEQSIVMPYCTNFSDVDDGEPVLAWREDHDDHAMAIYGGNFAAAYGLAQQTENGWVSEEGEAVMVTVSLQAAGAYYDEFMARSVHYTDDRADYPNLSDAEFANFREVNVTGIAPHRLYRSASPVNNKHNRAPYAAAELEAAGVRVVLNLADSSEELQALPVDPDSAYAEMDVIALGMSMDLTMPENMTRLAEGLRFVLEHEGAICVHCLEGKDRTGFVCAVLERLAGASREEILAEYMISYRNYYGVTPESGPYAPIAASFEKALVKGMGEPLDAKDYLKRCGLTEQEIEALVLRLSR